MVSIMGSAQVDSRISVPNEVSCSHTRELSRIIANAAAGLSAGSLGLALCGVPLGRVGLLELRAGHEGSVQIFRIADDTGHDQPDIAVGLLETVEVFLDRGVGTVGHAVLAQVAGSDLRRRDLEVAVLGWRGGLTRQSGSGREPRGHPAEATARSHPIPQGHRVALPARARLLGGCAAEVKQPRL